MVPLPPVADLDKHCSENRGDGMLEKVCSAEGLSPSLPSLPSLLRDDVFNDATMDVGEAEVATLETVGEAFVVEA
jgi:hypothetical protein